MSANGANGAKSNGNYANGAAATGVADAIGVSEAERRARAHAATAKADAARALNAAAENLRRDARAEGSLQAAISGIDAAARDLELTAQALKTPPHDPAAEPPPASSAIPLGWVAAFALGLIAGLLVGQRR